MAARSSQDSRPVQWTDTNSSSPFHPLNRLHVGQILGEAIRYVHKI